MPWYNIQLLEQRKVARNREREFNKYKRIITGGAFTRNEIDIIECTNSIKDNTSSLNSMSQLKTIQACRKLTKEKR